MKHILLGQLLVYLQYLYGWTRASRFCSHVGGIPGWRLDGPRSVAGRTYGNDASQVGQDSRWFGGLRPSMARAFR